MQRVDIEQWKGREVARLLALVETERRYYQEIVASLPIGLAVVARSGVVQSANRAFRQILHLRADDVHRRTVEQLLPSPELISAINQMPAAEATPATFRVTTGGRDLRISAIPVRDWDDDTDVEVLLVLEDHTGVVASLPAAAHDAPAFMWTANPDTMEFSAIAGEESGAVHPGFAYSSIHIDDHDRILEFYRHALATPGQHAYEYRAVKGDHEIVWYRDAFTVTANGTNKAAGVVTDVTQRRQAELMTQQANRLDALTTLSRSLSHDLNNPLMIVTGYAEDLLASLESVDTRRADVQEILGAADRIAGLTSQLLNYTRRQANPAQPVVVAEAVARALLFDNLQTQVPSHLRAMADPVQLSEAIAAILAKVRQQGRATIEARAISINEHLADGPATGDYIEIVFASPAFKTISFDSLIPGKDPGGPEVARAHLLVREWGGGIWQASGEIHLVLPAAPPLPVEPLAPKPETHVAIEVEPHPPVESTAPSAPTAEPVAEQPVIPLAETILVVEDEGGIRALVRKILRRQNYEVLEAGNADEAVAVAASHKGKIDLLITDMSLPGRNGRQLADHLKTSLPLLKVMYVSGYSDDPAVYDREQLPSGAAFLQKPFTLGSLLKKVREVLEAGQ